MLKIIEPQDHGLYKHTIHSFLNLLKVYQKCDLLLNDEHAQVKSNATFIIAEDDDRGVYGGAVLFTQPVSLLYEKIAKVILKFQPERQDVWLGRLCFCVEDNKNAFTLSALDFYQNFYVELYKALIEFGAKKDLDFLALTLHYKDYENIKTYGYWPYLLEVQPVHAPDFCFHGLLDIIHNQNKVCNKIQHARALSSGQTNRQVR
ncbi:MAG: hypothetical protein BGO67_08555 [Alphaproteobacteria bacterium 41-28]|nr:MAG: hypothetical protein BGO67_08555 [Alphaproteobacteria bacterium 41-28]